jgi:hypothetical protein
MHNAATMLMRSFGRAGRALPAIKGRGRLAIALTSLLLKAGANPIVQCKMAAGHRRFFQQLKPIPLDDSRSRWSPLRCSIGNCRRNTITHDLPTPAVSQAGALMYFYEPVGLPLESLRRSLEHIAFRALHVNVYNVRIPIGGGEIIDGISLNDFSWPAVELSASVITWPFSKASNLAVPDLPGGDRMDDGTIRNGVQLNVAQVGLHVCRSSLNSKNKSVGTDRLRKQHSHDALMGPQIEDDRAWFQFRSLQKRDTPQKAAPDRIAAGCTLRISPTNALPTHPISDRRRKGGRAGSKHGESMQSTSCWTANGNRLRIDLCRLP